MHSNWAAENLQVIRTLMERSALYRRALAPMMLMTGAVGAGAAILGGFLRLESPAAFVCYWLVVSLVAMFVSFLLLRGQAIRASETVFSPPTRRVLQALLPAYVAALLISLPALLPQGGEGPLSPIAPQAAFSVLPVAWVVLYGCAAHAAGFFMPRGIKLFGWAFVLAGCGLTLLRPAGLGTPAFAQTVMGVVFGGFHTGYGVYLYFTEQRKRSA